MKSIKVFLIVSAFALTISSCQKQKLERLSGTWTHLYFDVNPNDGIIPIQYDSITLGCNYFRMKQIYTDDVYIQSCQCFSQTDWISGTYTVVGNKILFDGIFEDSVFIDFSTSTDTIYKYKTTFKFCVNENKLKLVGPDQSIKENGIEWKKISDIKCQ